MRKWREEIDDLSRDLRLLEDRISDLTETVDEQATTIKELCEHIKVLEEIHPEKTEMKSLYDYCRKIEGVYITTPRTHKPVTVNTDKCVGVTFEELARYVIDGKPISRDVNTVVVPPHQCSCKTEAVAMAAGTHSNGTYSEGKLSSVKVGSIDEISETTGQSYWAAAGDSKEVY